MQGSRYAVRVAGYAVVGRYLFRPRSRPRKQKLANSFGFSVEHKHEYDWVTHMDEEIRKILDEDHRQHLYTLWGRAKEGHLDGLTDDEER